MFPGNLPSQPEILSKGSKLYLPIWPTISAQPAIATSDDVVLPVNAFLYIIAPRSLGLVTIQNSEMSIVSWLSAQHPYGPSELPNLQIRNVHV